MRTNAPKSIKTKRCVLWNANGLRNKILELAHFVKKHKPGFILITEARIPQEAKTPYLPEYTLLVTEKTQVKHGVAIFIHKTINFTQIDIKTERIETIAIKASGTILVCGYQKPGITFNQTDLDTIFEEEKVVLAGDLNAKNQLWECH